MKRMHIFLMAFAICTLTGCYSGRSNPEMPLNRPNQFAITREDLLAGGGLTWYPMSEQLIAQFQEVYQTRHAYHARLTLGLGDYSIWYEGQFYHFSSPNSYIVDPSLRTQFYETKVDRKKLSKLIQDMIMSHPKSFNLDYRLIDNLQMWHL